MCRRNQGSVWEGGTRWRAGGGGAAGHARALELLQSQAYRRRERCCGGGDVFPLLSPPYFSSLSASSFHPYLSLSLGHLLGHPKLGLSGGILGYKLDRISSSKSYRNQSIWITQNLSRKVQKKVQKKGLSKNS